MVSYNNQPGSKQDENPKSDIIKITEKYPSNWKIKMKKNERR